MLSSLLSFPILEPIQTQGYNTVWNSGHAFFVFTRHSEKCVILCPDLQNTICEYNTSATACGFAKDL